MPPRASTKAQAPDRSRRAACSPRGRKYCLLLLAYMERNRYLFLHLLLARQADMSCKAGTSQKQRIDKEAIWHFSERRVSLYPFAVTFTEAGLGAKGRKEYLCGVFGIHRNYATSTFLPDELVCGLYSLYLVQPYKRHYPDRPTASMARPHPLHAQ